MKALFFALIASVVSISAAHANDTRVQTYTTILVHQSRSGNFCPEIKSIVAVQKPGSLEGETLTLNLTNGTDVTLEYTYATTSCVSDMICLTTNQYKNFGEMMVELTRNNDGEYPTKDLAGYSDLNILVPNPATRMLESCVYMLRD